MKTLQEFIIEKHSEFLPSFVQLDSAIKIISSKLRKAGLEGNLGLTGTRNVYGEEVQKLDDFANTLLVEKMASSLQIKTVLSEELEEPITANEHGQYIFAMDPLDGSSNIDVGINIGTIFSFYDAKKGLLQSGKNQLVAGYVMYGFSTILVITFGDKVHGFTLDEEVDSFFLTHENMKIPKEGKFYSLNQAYYHDYSNGVKSYLDYILKENKYGLRYVGAMVADVHRTILKGGVFIYPESKKAPNGKLRLIYEINPMSMIIKVAGGLSLSLGKDPMEIVPEKHDQTLPVILGSENNVKKFLEY